MRHCLFWSVTTLLLTLGSAHAHPTTFKGGVAAYSRLQPGMATVTANYTFHRRAAIATTYQRIVLPDTRLEGAQGHLNLLLYRFNGQGAQGNLYASLGAGIANAQTTEPSAPYGFDDLRPIYSGGLQADFETRKVYTAFQSNLLWTDQQRPFWLRYRFGLAPYVAHYGELQTWLVVQSTWFPDMESGVNITPLMRFFYRTVLWEVGADLSGRPWIQLMAHF